MGAQAYSMYDDDQGGSALGRQQHSDMLMKTDFKWLMAGVGYSVDPDRLERDAEYAAVCLRFALASDCDPLRACAHCLRAEWESTRLLP